MFLVDAHDPSGEVVWVKHDLLMSEAPSHAGKPVESKGDGCEAQSGNSQ